MKSHKIMYTHCVRAVCVYKSEYYNDIRYLRYETRNAIALTSSSFTLVYYFSSTLLALLGF